MTRFSLDKLLAPSSIAVVGASTREEAVGSVVIRNLQTMGFEGPIYPVNPRYSEVWGLPCYPALTSLPTTPDAVFIGIPVQAGPDVLAEAGASGIKGAIINASGYSDGGPEGAALQDRLKTVADEYGIALCGPNNVGFVNVRRRTPLWTIPDTEFHSGPVAVVGQSGSASMILAEDPKSLGIAYAITTGNEAVLTVADYLAYLVRDDDVRLILLFLETIRDPGTFAQAAMEAAARGKRIMAIKVGRSEGGQAAVMAHTGSIAGEDDVYNAFFKRYGVIRVDDFDEMLETAALFAAYPDPPTNRHVVPITLSGGEAALAADLGASTGVSMPPFAPSTVERVRAALAPFSTPRNPLDAWGLGWSTEGFTEITHALLADDLIGTIAPAVDTPASGKGDADFAVEMVHLFMQLAPHTSKRFVFINNTSASGTDSRLIELCAQAGFPCLVGLRAGLAALGHWSTYTAPDTTGLVSGSESLGTYASGDINTSGPLGEGEAYRLLSGAGIPMVESHAVETEGQAIQEATRIGYPVVLKGNVVGVSHKTELGLVRLGLESADAVIDAFRDLSSKIDRRGQRSPVDGIVIQPMQRDGVELIVGARNDPKFGTVIVVGVGGIHVEILKEVSVRLGPLDRETALTMLRETQAGRLLTGVRGRGPYDVEAAVDAIVALSRFGEATRGVLAAVEINPLMVFRKGSGALGVDALLEPAPVEEPAKYASQATRSF